MKKIKLAVVFLGRKRPGFDPDWGAKIEAEVKTFFTDSQYEAFIPQYKIIDDSSMRRIIAECEQNKCNVLLVFQTTAGDARLAPVMAQLWDGPIVLWATPENPEGRMISSCSLVGIHIFASTLRQIGKPFEIVYGAPTDVRTIQEFDDAVRVAYAARYLRKSKIGLIGYNAPGYANMAADAASLSRGLGAQLHHIGLQELLDAMKALPASEVVDDVNRVLEMNLPMVDVEKSDLEIQSRFYLAFKQLIATETLDALAVRCWPELPNVTGQWPYFAMARLSNEGYPCGMEGDVDGAISCLTGEIMGFGRGYLSDWLEHTEDTINLWHGGNSPFDLSEPVGTEHGPRLTKHFNIKKPMVLESWLKAGMDITVFRLWRCDGQYFMTARDGCTIQPQRDLAGTNGLARIKGGNVHQWFVDLCHAGMPHHIAIFQGHHSDTLRKFARLMNIKWVDLE